MKDYQKRTIQTYDEHAKEFDDSRAQLAMHDRMDEFLSVLPGKSVLEVGCGPGRDARIFVDKGFDVVGVDLSKGLLDVARIKVPEAKFKNIDATDLQFNNNVFDGVWASAVYLHLSLQDFQKALREAFRVLKPDGIIRFSIKKGEGSSEEEDERLKNAKRLFFFYTREQVERFVVNTGFSMLNLMENEGKRNEKKVQWIDVIAKKPI
jgi:ubiquinone/menaquinone biosynthesis C-methylase UbiE